LVAQRHLLGILHVAIAALLLAVFPPPAQADATIDVGDFYFSPSAVLISPGETVTWVIKKGFHTTTNGIGDADPQAGTLWDALVFSGQPAASYTFTVPGVYPYYCRFHETLSMTGAVTVASPPTATSERSWGAVKSLYR